MAEGVTGIIAAFVSIVVGGLGMAIRRAHVRIDELHDTAAKKGELHELKKDLKEDLRELKSDIKEDLKEIKELVREKD